MVWKVTLKGVHCLCPTLQLYVPQYMALVSFPGPRTEGILRATFDPRGYNTSSKVAHTHGKAGDEANTALLTLS